MVKEYNGSFLESFLLDKTFVIIDTSSLLEHRKSDQDPVSIQEKILKVHDRYYFANLLWKYIGKNDNCYITNLVSEEYESGRYYPYRRMIKKSPFGGNRELLTLRRRIRDLAKEGRKLIRLFEDRQKILKLDRHESKRHNYFKEKYRDLYEENGLSETDADYLASGFALIKTRGPISLLSNDIHINGVRNTILRREGLNFKSLSFFFRTNIDQFEKLPPYWNYFNGPFKNQLQVIYNIYHPEIDI